MDMEPRTISNTEVENHNRCEYVHYYANGLNLTQRKLPNPLAIGIAGHEVLAHYYEMLRAGADQTSRGMECMELFGEIVERDKLDFEVETPLQRALYPFFKAKTLPHDNWEILEIERTYQVTDVPGAVNNYFGFTIDLLIREKSTGKVVLVDHKFVNDFWTLAKAQFAAQPRKYKWGLNRLGIPVETTYIHQLRYRDLKNAKPEDRVKVLPVPTTEEEDLEFMRNHQLTANEIARLWELGDLQKWKSQIRRQTNYASCKGCMFADPCATQYKRKSAKSLLTAEYKPNTRYSEQYNTHASDSDTPPF